MTYKNYEDRLIIGNKYWIFKINDTLLKSVIETTDNGITYLNYNKSFYDAMSLCILKSTFYKRNECNTLPKKTTLINTVYCFNSVDNYFETHKIEYTDLDRFVYVDRDDYLVSLVKAQIRWGQRSDNTILRFDNFLKQKIKESQDKNPEKWIY